MSTEVTAKELALAARRVALVRYPGTDAQRLCRLVDVERDDAREAAVAYALRRWPDAPLAWLHHADGTLEPIDTGNTPTDPADATRAALARILATV